MPVYNGENYIKDAIDSILGQDLKDFEFIVVDDGSTDRSRKILMMYSDDRLKVIANEVNRGVEYSRNIAIANAVGEYVALLDCDDIALIDRLSHQAAFLDARRDIGMVGSWVEVMNCDGVSTGEVWKLSAAPEEIPLILLFHNYFTHSSVMIRRNILSNLRYRPFAGATDYDLWIRIAGKHKVWNIQKVLVRYRIHENSMSERNVESMEFNVRRVLFEYLKELGVEASEEEMDLHRQLGTYNFDLDLEMLGRADMWLQKLCEANLRTHLYDAQQFTAFIGKKWYDLNYTATLSGLNILKQYISSRLSSYNGNRIKNYCSLALRHALKY